MPRALNPEAEAAADARAAAVQARWGHPQHRWDDLIAIIQNTGVTEFDAIRDGWLELMWCLDQYRITDAPPEAMGKAHLPYDSRIDGVYRGKGNWFAMVLTLLLNNRTGQTLRSRSEIKGFSQNHQIDLAWPDRREAPIVCAESKLTGGPAYRNAPGRGAMDEWTNRRRELKFSATDLKLWRRSQSEKIGHWDVWRQSALPRTFMLWAALLSEKDSPEKMVRETSAIVSTYLDGAGIFAYRRRADGGGYEPVDLPLTAGVETIDIALYRIESEIDKAIASGSHKRPEASAAPVDPDGLVGGAEPSG
ncbi:MAG: hypothetical protein QOG56_219 [Solirubrobacteraceae bacterium]|nr:hypothetical protein [Solirubrobacteraceae bacterium]